MGRTQAQNKASFRARKAQAGFKRIEFWLKADEKIYLERALAHYREAKKQEKN